MKMPQEKALVMRPLQEQNVRQVMQEPATLIAQPLGSGKTTVAVEAVRRQFKGAGVSALVVAPRNTFYGWERAVRRQYQNYMNYNLFRRIDSSAEGKQAMADLWAGIPGWYIVSWQYFALCPEKFWDKLNPDVIILDEVQRMQNRKSKTWANMKGFGKKSKRIAMSGTPNGNRMEGFWTTLRWLFPETDLTSVYSTPLSFWRWVADWLIAEENEHLGFTEVKGERFELGTMLSYYESYIRESDEIVTPGVNEITVDVPLTAKQKSMYTQAVKDFVVWLKTPDPITGNVPMVVTSTLALRTRLRQITLGELSFSDTGTVVYADNMKSSKFDAMLDIIVNEVPDEPVLVFTHSRQWAVTATHMLQQRGIGAYAWVGGTSEKARRSVLATWGRPTAVQVIIAVVEAIAEGIDGLQDLCNNEIWVSESDNDLMNSQALKRTDRPGQTKIVNRWRIIAPDTYDQKILDGRIVRQLDLNKSLAAGKGN